MSWIDAWRADELADCIEWLDLWRIADELSEPTEWLDLWRIGDDELADDELADWRIMAEHWLLTDTERRTPP